MIASQGVAGDSGNNDGSRGRANAASDFEGDDGFITAKWLCKTIYKIGLGFAARRHYFGHAALVFSPSLLERTKKTQD
ncbi:hypothetical protein HPP92_006577 [Vanilla planifolia]|uniref:Uncharacterized protein n=1 Tax=Vanilla planifolia TaxID=51239 RepID=A0A835V6X0_VANPL|nr:hypothetical protein HPP92_006577 [Vanilla planifolia]